MAVGPATFAAGLGTGLSLIVAIGAQNAYVLRQGLRREHVALVAGFCAVADAVLIVAGVAGVGTLVERAPTVLDVMRYAGAAFLCAYALFALRRALRPNALIVDQADRPTARGTALATVAALTLLNPHVYLDTVLLLGTVAADQGPTGRWVFAAGAAAGSLAWFFGLGYGARLLVPVFARPAAWRVLDLAVAVVMILIAISLLHDPSAA